MFNSSRVKSIAIVIFSIVAIFISQVAMACTMSLSLVYKELNPRANANRLCRFAAAKS